MPTPKQERTRSELHDRVKALAGFRHLLRRFLSFSEEAAEAAGTSAQQYQLLQVVAAAPDGVHASISYIADHMVLRHNSAVELVGRAERSGLVGRQEDAADHRRALITLTPAGEEMLQGLVRSHWAEMERQGPALLKALSRLLQDQAAEDKQERKAP
jgi:DNA-binding MarR family transcriptional regulator